MKEGINVRTNILKAMKLGQISKIIYMKNDGEISKRKVKVLSVGGSTFKAYCFMRGTKRTFNVENVLAIVPVINKESVAI